MAEIPDMTGYLKEEAETLLRESGVQYVMSETTPPRGPIEGEELRVVRQVMKTNVLHITLCRY